MRGQITDAWSSLLLIRKLQINFDKAKKVSKARTHFRFDRQKSNLPVNPTIQMVAPVPQEEVATEETTPQPSEDRDSGETYEAQPDDMSVSTGDIEIAVRVACASEAFLGRCFRCNKVRHRFRDEECEMCDPDFLNSGQRPAKTSLNRQVPRAKNTRKPTGAKTSQ